MIGPTGPKLLVVGQPKTLPVVQKEVDYIQKLSDFVSVNVLINADASRDTVLDRLQEHSWVHFACHGRLGDNSQPFHGSFELDDDDRLFERTLVVCDQRGDHLGVGARRERLAGLLAQRLGVDEVAVVAERDGAHASVVQEGLRIYQEW